MRTIELFAFLQFLDLSTTLLGFRLGQGELSPFIRALLAVGPVAGLMLGKSVAVAIGAVCVATGRMRTMEIINYWSAGLVIWNLIVILRAVRLI